jgi:hypothetical protein
MRTCALTHGLWTGCQCPVDQSGGERECVSNAGYHSEQLPLVIFCLGKGISDGSLLLMIPLPFAKLTSVYAVRTCSMDEVKRNLKLSQWSTLYTGEHIADVTESGRMNTHRDPGKLARGWACTFSALVLLSRSNSPLLERYIQTIDN